MYLLNRIKYRIIPCGQPRFTFHYVSIKSKELQLLQQQQRYLHSTMYLLNHFNQYQEEYDYINLHSTMYLLNQIAGIKD